MSRQIKRLYEFGPYRIDSVNRLLERSGDLVPLKTKVIDTLLLLLERPGQVVEKEELMSRLWPDSFVEEANLTQNIYVLRKALADADHIETIPRRGYRFVTEVRTREEVSAEAPPAPAPEPEPESAPAPKPEADRALTPAAATPPRSHARVLLVAGAAAGIAAIAILGFWLLPAKTPFREIRLTRLTTTGKTTRAAISPDGRYLAFVSSEAGKQSLHLKQIAAGKDLELLPPAIVDYYGLTFSHDANFIYYVNQEVNHVGRLFRVPALGGAPAGLIDDVDSPVTLSPDDRRLAFIRFTPGERSLVVANADGTGERRLATTRSDSPSRIAPIPLIPPAWSPDGKTIACAVGVTTAKDESQAVHAFDAASGAERPLSPQSWQTIGRMEWLADGGGLLLTASEPGTVLPQQIWILATADGKARRVTNDLADYRDLSLAQSAGSVVAVQTERRGNVWVAPADGSAAPRQITSTNYDGLNGVAWTPDGRIVYTLHAGSDKDLWVSDPRGGAPEPLLRHAGSNRQPVVSPDGRYTVFVSNKTGPEHLWRIDADGRHPVELTHGLSDTDPSFTPDGQSVIYRAMLSGIGYVCRVPIDGGEPVKVVDKPAAAPVVSPDGSLIAVIYRLPPNPANTLAVVSSIGGEPRVIRELPAYNGRFRWTPDGRELAWTGRYEGIGGVSIQPLDGSPSRVLTRWGADPVFFFDWSRDGKWLAFSKGANTSDVVLITSSAH
ncbi:MAG TPA: winged helix-turn-helix domain-containing protein [Thermoanaerobaculia bacterium]|nr:winged helix-turn-helix domain-containing protein [Thermoanaerobaculia bacterium]